MEGTASTCARSIQTKPNAHRTSTLEKSGEDHLPHLYVAASTICSKSCLVLQGSISSAPSRCVR